LQQSLVRVIGSIVQQCAAISEAMQPHKARQPTTSLRCVPAGGCSVGLLGTKGRRRPTLPRHHPRPGDPANPCAGVTPKHREPQLTRGTVFSSSAWKRQRACLRLPGQEQRGMGHYGGSPVTSSGCPNQGCARAKVRPENLWGIGCKTHEIGYCSPVGENLDGSSPT